jgi:dsRNA-specific ribonuclease
MQAGHKTVVVEPAPSQWKPPGLAITASALPGLPMIRDAVVLRRVFVHPSAVNVSSSPAAEKSATSYYLKELESYERDEWVGDGALNHCVSIGLAKRYWYLSPGCLSVRLQPMTT